MAHEGAVIDAVTKGEGFITAGLDGWVRSWVCEGEAIDKEDEIEVEGAVAIDVCGDIIAVVTYGGYLQVMKGKFGLVKGINTEKNAVSVSISPDSSEVAVGHLDGSVTVTVTETAEKTIIEPHFPVAVRSLVWTPDGGLLLAGYDNGRVISHDTGPEYQTVGIYPSHSSSVTGLAALPDSTRVASASADRTIRIQDLALHRTVHTFDGGHEKAVTSVDVKSDGTRLVSVGDDGAMQIYSL